MLEIKEITKKYGDKYALNKVSLELKEGVYALLGPNGAGKSTLMNLITENLKPDNGEILWEQTPIQSLGAKYRRLLGYAPQQQGLYEAFTGRRFLHYMGALKKIPKDDLPGEMERAAASVNLTSVIDRRISTYSGGMKQRLLIAQAVMGQPKILIMDEPTAGLDPEERVRIREYIHHIAEGKIILVATHVVSDIESIANEVIILKKGKIVEKDTVPALCERYERGGGLEEVYVRIFEEGEEAG